MTEEETLYQFTKNVVSGLGKIGIVEDFQSIQTSLLGDECSATFKMHGLTFILSVPAFNVRHHPVYSQYEIDTAIAGAV